MPTRYTADIESGRNLSVNDYILNTARAMGLFINLRDSNVDITKMSREELVECVQSSTSYYEQGVAEHTQQIANAKNLLKGEQLETELASISKSLAYDQENLDKGNKSNYQRSAIAGALYDNLPGGKVEVKVGKLALQEPNEMGELFGANYKGIDRSEPSKAIAMLQEIISSVQNMSDEQKAELLSKKMGYETKSYQYGVDKDNLERARYDGMIGHIQDWNPVYQNDQDKELEKEATDYFAGHKKFALNQLTESKEFDCRSEDWQEREKSEYERKMETLQGTQPADFADMLQYNIANRINGLTAQMQRKDKGDE